MKVKTPVLGELVKSTSGRDAGRFFVIMEIIDENKVYITDGMLRKIAKPKKKKVKHLELEPVVFEQIAQKFADGARVFDQEVASAILTIDYCKKH